jgi:hypothetical protein
LHCHAGCSTEAVCTKIGVTIDDLFPNRVESIDQPKKIVATYPYSDADGNLLFEVVRFAPKDFRQRRPESTALNSWSWSTRGIPKVLYRLPETLKAIADGDNIYICEGEKDVNEMVKRGFPATCNPGGAGKWQDSGIA